MKKTETIIAKSTNIWRVLQQIKKASIGDINVTFPSDRLVKFSYFIKE